MSAWTVKIQKKAKKGIAKLPEKVRSALKLLMREIKVSGPVKGNWPNYGKLFPTLHHCHLKKGNPTYVAVLEVRGREINLVEVIYAGTHEKAPY